ncbi:hypothetical protein BJX96DRAFT_144199 [Aspergillus floccosus]
MKDFFGDVTTEPVWFDKGLESITMYTYYGFDGVYGIRVGGPSGTYSVSSCKSETQATLTLRAPDEELTQIDVSASPLHMRLKTNYGRQAQFRQPRPEITERSLRPPPGTYITGLYFRLVSMHIESVGLIYADRSRREHHEEAEKELLS